MRNIRVFLCCINEQVLLFEEEREEKNKKKDKGIPLSFPHTPADIRSDYLKIFQHVLTRDNIRVM